MLFRDYLTQTLGQDSGLRSVLISAACSVRKISDSLDITKGKSQTVNLSGDVQLEMDVLADIIVHDTFLECDQVSILASEEREEEVILNGDQFSVAYDPLDGSSLIDANFAVGTIFAIFPGTHLIGRKSSDMVAALYAVYGPKTSLVFSVGKGVHEFILTQDGFELSRENIKISLEGKYFAPGNMRACADDPKYKKLVDQWISERYTLRYSGGMVPDINHIFVKGGGIFAYPGSVSEPKGKLRLLYECGPMAYLMTEAGGTATDGVMPILDLPISSLHQRTPIFIGSKHEVEKAMAV